MSRSYLWLLGWMTSTLSVGAQAPVMLDFQAETPGNKPSALTAIGEGHISIIEEAGNHFVELAAEPVEETSLLFGPSQKGSGHVTARIKANKARRAFPRFGISLFGVSGVKLRVSPVSKTLELVKGADEATVLASVPWTWKENAWLHLELTIVAEGQQWRAEARAWNEGDARTESPLLSSELKSAPGQGKAGVFGTPYANKPIWFDDLGSKNAEESTKPSPLPSTPPTTPDGSAKPSAKGASLPGLKQLSPTRREFNGIEFDIESREIFLPAKLNMRQEVIEYLLVTDSGKVHESLLSTGVKPFDLNVVLILLHFAPAKDYFGQSGARQQLKNVAEQSLLEVFLKWKDPSKPNAPEQELRAEKWIKNILTKTTAEETPWVYNGSEMTEDQAFAAAVDGTFFATYLDVRCLFNSPRIGAEDDLLWFPNTDVLPAKDTPVTVILRPYKKT